MFESVTRQNCRLPSCRNGSSFLRCTSRYSGWFRSLPHAQIVSKFRFMTLNQPELFKDTSRYREKCYAAAYGTVS